MIRAATVMNTTVSTPVNTPPRLPFAKGGLRGIFTVIKMLLSLSAKQNTHKE